MGLYLKKGNLVEPLSTPSLQVESIFPMAHNMEKVKTTSLCFFCSYVKIWSIKVTIRKDERLTPSTYNEENVKRTSLCFLCSYVKMGAFR